MERQAKKKKSWPTNCPHCNKRIRRKDWYYRDGKYFASKRCYQLYREQEAEKAAKAKEAAAQAAPQGTPTGTATEQPAA